MKSGIAGLQTTLPVARTIGDVLLWAKCCQTVINARACVLGRVRLSATPWTVVSQAPPSMGFPRQEYWSGLPFFSPGDLPNPGIEPASPVSPASYLFTNVRFP